MKDFYNKGFLKIAAVRPSPTHSTPQALRYVQGYGIHSISKAKTSGDVPRGVYVIGKTGITILFEFEDGESIGQPVTAVNEDKPCRLMMVDAEGWSVTNEPAYYDLYPGNGDRYRFIAASISDQYLQFSSYRSVTGREETMADAATEVIKDENGILRQIKAPTCLIDIVFGNAYKYAIDFYRIEDIEPDKNQEGLYEPISGELPVIVWAIENPDSNTINKLNIAKTMGSTTKTSRFSWVEASEEWTLAVGDGLRTRSKDRLWDDALVNAVSDDRVRNNSGTIVSKTRRYMRSYPWGLEITKKILDPDNAALTTEFDFFTSGYATKGLWKSRENSDGSWTRYAYDSLGRKTAKIYSWKNSPIDAGSETVRAHYYSYAEVTPDDTGVLNDHRPRTITEKLLGTTVSKTFYAFVTNSSAELIEIEEKCSSPEADYGDASNLRTLTTHFGTNAPSHLVGRIKTKEYSDGRLNTYAYQAGNYHSETEPEDCWFEPASTGTAWRVTITRGTTNSPSGIENKTTKETSVFDKWSQRVLSEQYIYTGGTNYQRITWTVNTFDNLHHLSNTYRSNGTITDTSWGTACCGKENETTVAGIEHAFEYDALGRLITSWKIATNSANDIATTHTYDANNRRLSTTITGAGLPPIRISTNTYDLAGRITTSSDTLGIETAYSYQSGGRITTVARAGITNTTARYLDGRTNYTEQNGIRKQTYDYGVNTNSMRWTKVYTGSDGTNSPVWSKTTTDMLGRTIKTERPGFDGTTITTTYTYNNKSQLTKKHAPCG